MIELRPALDGHGGIPQETRLLAHGLTRVAGAEVIGLIQSGNLVVEAGEPINKPLSPADRADRMSKVVVSLQQGPTSIRAEHWRRRVLKLGGPFAAAAAGIVGLKTPLTRFDPAPYRDFVWRSMFARTLPADAIDDVTGIEYRILRWPWSLANAVGVATGALGHAAYPRLDTSGVDVFVAETPYPGRVARGTRLVVRYHDAIPLLMPHTIKDRGYHRSMHMRALRRNAADGAWFACVSDSTRRDLLSILPEVESRAVTIPNMILPTFSEGDSEAHDIHGRVADIVAARRSRRVPAPLQADGGNAFGAAAEYLLMVSTIEPRKNHLAVLDAWEQLRRAGFPNLHLVLVGSLGWEHGEIMERMTPGLERGGVHLLHDVPAADLKLLYRFARVTVCPSFGEGFDFSGVEAMACGGVVAASDIPVHREVYGDAAEYFSPYDARRLASLLAKMIVQQSPGASGPGEGVGRLTAARYTPLAVLPQWASFLGRVLGA